MIRARGNSPQWTRLGCTAGPRTFGISEYDDLPHAVMDLRAGTVNAVFYIPENFSRNVLKGQKPRIALIVDNSDAFTTAGILERIQEVQTDLNGLVLPRLRPNQFNMSDVGVSTAARAQPSLVAQIDIQTVEVYPYITYTKYLLAGLITLSISFIAIIAGGIEFIEDKARGLHEGYLATPVTNSDLVLGFISAGALKSTMVATAVAIIGGLVSGIERMWDPVRLIYLILVIASASIAMMSFMFFTMIRVDHVLTPRALSGMFSTLLFFPSGAIYPVEGFPYWLRIISRLDPLTYAVDALRSLMLKNAGLRAIYMDVAILIALSVLLTLGCIAFFKRQI